MLVNHSSSVGTRAARAGLGALLVILLSGFARGESLLIVGTGRSGSWDTVLEISNGGATAVTIQLGPTPGFQAICPAPCPLPTRLLNPGQTLRLTPDDLTGYHPAGVGASYVNANIPDTGSLTVRARTINTAVPTQSAEIPVVRLSTVTGLNAAFLSFPGATRGPASHSNVLLAEVTGTAPAIVLFEAIDVNGAVLASSTQTVPRGGTLFLVDALAVLGVNSLEDGQVRVTRQSGGSVWGWIGTVFPNAGVHIGLGKNP